MGTGGLYEPMCPDGSRGNIFIDRAMAHTGAGMSTGGCGRGTGECFFPGPVPL